MNNPNTKGMLVKQNPLINSKYRLPIYELRIFNFLVSEVGKNDTGITEHTLSFKKIIDECNIDSSNLYKNEAEYIKNTVRKLKSRVIDIEDEHRWRAISLFEEAYINKDKKGNYINEVTFQLSDKIRPLILELKKNFTKIDLSYLKILNSFYSLRFYEISLAALRNRSSCTYELSVSHIKYIFNLEKKFARFDNFKARVLNSSKKEINLKTNLNFDFELIQSDNNKRKIERIRFIVSRKNKEKEVCDIEEEPKEIEEKPQELDSFDEDEQELFDKVIQYGVDNKKAKSLIKKYPLNQITEALEVVEYDSNNPKKNITNIAGYVVSAIEKAFKIPNETKQEELKIKIHNLNNKLEDLKDEKKSLENHIKKNKLLIIKNSFLSEQESLINDYVQKMINNNNEYYEYVLSLEKKIKGYSSKELVEKPPALLVYHIHLMLIEYASQSSIKFEEDFDKNKKILDIDNLISEIEDKIELSKNIKSKLK